KSTLFNRLVGRRQALVRDVPGVTRDRLYGVVAFERWQATVVDTGGFDPSSEEPLIEAVRAQVLTAIDEADLILLVVDARAGGAARRVYPAAGRRDPAGGHAPAPAGRAAAPAGTGIAVVGRPNVGKSSLVNALVGTERVLVHDQPGTTRDAVDTPFTYRDRPY